MLSLFQSFRILFQTVNKSTQKLYDSVITMIAIFKTGRTDVLRL